MISLQNTKIVSLLKPQSVGTSEVSAYVDTYGYAYAQVHLHADTAAASSVLTELAIKEGTSTSSFSAITALTGGTSDGNFTLPVPNTSTPDIVRFNIDLRKRKRYLAIAVASTTARLCSATVILGRPKRGVTSAGEAGCSTVVTV
jgi:hypothetical protein